MSEKTGYITIYRPDGSIFKEAIITKEAKREESLMNSDLLELSWNDIERTAIPVGSYVFDSNGEKLSLYDPYEPEQKDEGQFRYTPQFQSRIMGEWGKTTLFFYTYGADGKTITAKEPEWTLTDSALTFMNQIAKVISVETGETWRVAVAEDLSGYKTIQFSNTDIVSALNAVADEWETEWYADKANNTLHLGKAMIGTPSETILSVGENIKVPSVTNNREGYFNRFYIFGSTRNITQDYQGANVNNLVNKRLTLDPRKYPYNYIDKRTSANEPVLTKTLIFDEIYPKSGLVVSEARARLMYVLDGDSNKVQIGTDSSGQPIYDTYSIWYIQLANKNEAGTLTPYRLANTDTYSKDNPDGVLIAGKALSVHFSSGSLLGREFELTYHTEGKTVTNTDGVPFTVKEGDFEILFTKESEYIIPAQTGLIPSVGDSAILFNLRMPEEYTGHAYEELEKAALKKIETYTSDRNNYEFASNPVVFAGNSALTNLKVGQAVTYRNGNYSYQTRIIGLSRKVDFPFEMTITVGNEPIKGTRQELKEEVANANKDINIMASFSQLAQNAIDSYDRAIREMQDGFAKIGRMWMFDPNNPNSIYTPYNVLGHKEISAYGMGSEVDGPGGGSGSGGNIGASYLSQLLDVQLNNPQSGESLVFDGSKWVNKMVLGGGLDIPQLENYLQQNNYLNQTQGDERWVTRTTAQTITGKKSFSVGSWVLSGNESNDITNCHFKNSTYRVGGNVVENLSAIMHGLRFPWYDDAWIIGTIRGMSYQSYGFGIGKLSADGTSVDGYLTITPTSLNYGANTVLHSGNYTSYAYSKADSDSRFVNTAGDTMTGNLTVPAILFEGTAKSYSYISSDTQTNMFFSCGGKVPLVIDDTMVSPGLNYTKTISLGTDARRWNSVYSVLGDFSDSISVAKAVKFTNSTQFWIGMANVGLGASWSGGLLLAYGANPIHFWTNSLSRMIITGGGDVGFGTENPQAKCHIAGDLIVDGNILSKKEITAYGTVSGSGGATTAYLLSQLNDVNINNPQSGESLVYNGSKWVNKVVSGGSVDASLFVKKSGDEMTGNLTFLGSVDNRSMTLTNSNIRLRVNANSGWAGGLQAYTEDNSTLLGYVAGAYCNLNSIGYYVYGGTYESPLMTIFPDGKVGVGLGAAIPSAKFHVGGDIKSDGSLTAATLYVKGSANSNAYISADSDRNIWFSCAGKVPFLVNDTMVAMGSLYASSISLGGDGRRWSNIYSVNANISGDITLGGNITPTSGNTLRCGSADSNWAGVHSRQFINNTYNNLIVWQTYNYDIMFAINGTYTMSIGTGGTITAMRGSFVNGSDRRLKSEITDLDFRGRLMPKRFWMNGRYDIGFIAQDVQLLYPELVYTGSDPDKTLGLNYGAITAVLSRQVNNLEDRFLTLAKKGNRNERRIKKLEAQIKDLQEEIEQLKAA